MEARLLQSIQLSSWIDAEKMMRGPGGFVRVPHSTQRKGGVNMFLTIQSNRHTSARLKSHALKVHSSLKKSQGSVLESSSFSDSLDDSLILKNKAVELEPYLNGRCIYLVGMMGSGKTTIGRLLSEALGYSFLDSDSLVEQIAGGLPVAEIFKQHGESDFRDKETEALHNVSVLNRHVISTGGGAVVRPINWKHMQKGVSVWLDVPIECLAQRISAVGTGTRPLLHGEEGNAYDKAFARLSTLFEERHEAYANANVRVSLENIVAKLGLAEANDLSPADIAIEVLEQIKSFLSDDGLAI